MKKIAIRDKKERIRPSDAPKRGDGRNSLRKSEVKKRSVAEGLVSPALGLYESILDGITSGVWATDVNDVISYANKAMEMIAGVTQQKLRGYRVLEDSSESAIDYFRQHYREAKETLQPVYYSEIPVVTPA